MNQKTKGIFTIFGGFLLHIIVGTVYTMPSISRYFYSYLIGLNIDSFTYANIDSVFSINIIVLSCVVPIGVIIERYCGIINTSCFGLLLIISSQAFMIFIPQYQLVQYSLIASALGSSMLYLPVVLLIWKYYPESKGMNTGICLSGLGINRLLFKYASLFIINPDEVGLTNNKDRYPENINDNFQYYMKLLLCFYCIVGLMAVMCIFPFEEGSENKGNHNDSIPLQTKGCNSVRDGNCIGLKDNLYSINNTNLAYSYSVGLTIKNRNSSRHQNKVIDENNSIFTLMISVPFIQLTTMYFCSRIFATIELSSIKKFGILNGHGEAFLNISSFIWKIVNGSCYQYWGLLVDKYGFKNVYMSIIIIQITVSSSAYFISANQITFLIFNFLTAAANCGNITLAPISYAIIFGLENGSLLFSLSSMITNTFYLCRPLIRRFVNEKIHYLIFYLIISLFSMFALIILCFFDEKGYVSKNKRHKDSSISLDNND